MHFSPHIQDIPPSFYGTQVVKSTDSASRKCKIKIFTKNSKRLVSFLILNTLPFGASMVYSVSCQLWTSCNCDQHTFPNCVGFGEKKAKFKKMKEPVRKKYCRISKWLEVTLQRTTQFKRPQSLADGVEGYVEGSNSVLPFQFSESRLM